MRFKDFQYGTMTAILDIKTERLFCNSEALCRSDASNQVSVLSHLRSGICRLQTCKMAAVVAILDFGTERFQQF